MINCRKYLSYQTKIIGRFISFIYIEVWQQNIQMLNTNTIPTMNTMKILECGCAKAQKKEGLVPNNPKESEVSNVVAFAENNEIY